MKLDELKRLAVTMGISGTSKMRKSDLLAAIQNRGDTVRPPAARSNTADKSADKSADKAVDAPAQDAPKAERAPKAAAAESDAPSRARAESAPVEGAKADSGHADSGHADSGHADSGKAESAAEDGSAGGAGTAHAPAVSGSGGITRGRRSGPIATKVKSPSVTFMVSSPSRSRRQTSTWMPMEVRPTRTIQA